MAGSNSFKETVESLFHGMDSVITSKTVVGEAIHINGTIILPLMDVSFGIGAGSCRQKRKRNGWNWWKNDSKCCYCHSGR